MPRWWLLGIRNWWDSPGRCAAIVISVALGAAIVVIITSFHETADRAITQEAIPRFFGRAHLTVHPPGGHWGKIDSGVATPLRGLDNVEHVSARLHRRMRLLRPERDTNNLLDTEWSWVDAFGLDDVATRHFVTPPGLSGRMIEPDETGTVLLERETAAEWGVNLGGTIILSPYQGGPKKELDVVGLFDSERVAEFQFPVVYVGISDVQEVGQEPDTASIIDIMLKDASPDAIRAAQQAVESVVAAYPSPYPYHVQSAAGRQVLLDEANRMNRFALVSAALLAMLTAFFITVTTMGTSLVERRTQLGLMRCLGVTRGQMGAMLFGELIPLGVLGLVMGTTAGLTLVSAVPWLSDGIIKYVTISRWGLTIAIITASATILVSAGLLAFQAGRVRPLAVLYADARPPRLGYVTAVGVIGVAFLFVHELLFAAGDPTSRLETWFVSAVALTLYLGYIMIAPALVRMLGPILARVVGPLVGIRSELARDQFGRAPWRSAGVCWVLLVGLSLIVYIGVSTQAILAVWDFPARLPEAFVWSSDYVPSEAVERVRNLPGVRNLVTTTDVECTIESPDEPKSAVSAFVRNLRSKLVRPVYVATDPERALEMVRIVFLEGTKEEAIEKLKRGGFVVIPIQTSKQKGLHVGDRVKVTVGDQTADLEIAGVVQSPALDMAVTAFQAESYMQIAAASALLGTHEDLRERFGFDGVSMMMCDLDFSSSSPPSFDPRNLPNYADQMSVTRALLLWQKYLPTEREALEPLNPPLRQWLTSGGARSFPEDAEPLLRRFGQAIQRVTWSCDLETMTRDDGWAILQERLILGRISQEIDRPDAVMGSLLRLRSEIDQNLRTALTILTWLPSILLVVAAFGVANLMMVNVRARARQLAVLRAIGAVRSQVMRLVLSEAITLALIGSALGVALGLHEAWSRNRIVAEMIGFQLDFIVPVGTVAIAVAVTVTVCLLAGLGPARHAARSNVVEAMQTA